jgi:hypothetical protein
MNAERKKEGERSDKPWEIALGEIAAPAANGIHALAVSLCVLFKDTNIEGLSCAAGVRFEGEWEDAMIERITQEFGGGV